jgi:hypothetical protein
MPATSCGLVFLELLGRLRTRTVGSPSRRRIVAAILPDAQRRHQHRPRGPAAVRPHLTRLPVTSSKRNGSSIRRSSVNCSAVCRCSAPRTRPPGVTLTALVHRAPDAAVLWYCQVERIQIVELALVWVPRTADDARPQNPEKALVDFVGPTPAVARALVAPALSSSADEHFPALCSRGATPARRRPLDRGRAPRRLFAARTAEI